MLIYCNDWVIITIVGYVILKPKKNLHLFCALSEGDESVFLKESSLCTLVKMLIIMEGPLGNRLKRHTLVP